MEIVLAIVVVGAVLFFGALISAGNERQRKAIDDLREEATLWAMQDLQIKREQLARGVKMDDPLGWLNRVAANACGHELALRIEQSFENPRSLRCASGADAATVIFSTLSPSEIERLKKGSSNRLSRNTGRNPLLSLPTKATAYPLSMLNAGMFFDLELPVAWQALTGQAAEGMQRLWMFLLP